VWYIGPVVALLLWLASLGLGPLDSGLPLIGELVDVGGVDDGAGGEGDEAVAGQGAGVVVGRNDTDPEPPFPAALGGFRVGGGRRRTEAGFSSSEPRTLDQGLWTRDLFCRVRGGRGGEGVCAGRRLGSGRF